MTRELIQAIYDNGLLWYLLHGLWDSADETSAKRTAEEVLTILTSVNINKSERKEIETYLSNILHGTTIDAETLLNSK